MILVDDEPQPAPTHSRSTSRHRSYGMIDAVAPSPNDLAPRPRRSASFSGGLGMSCLFGSQLPCS
jgi:hypothetical protein